MARRRQDPEQQTQTTKYIVLRANGGTDTWDVVGEYVAHSALQAIKDAAGKGSEAKAGDYWSVPARSANNRLTVSAHTETIVTYETPPLFPADESGTVPSE